MIIITKENNTKKQGWNDLNQLIKISDFNQMIFLIKKSDLIKILIVNFYYDLIVLN